jgi:hypothetical protein
MLALVATQGVFGKVEIALTYVNISKPTENADKTYRPQLHPNP